MGGELIKDGGLFGCVPSLWYSTHDELCLFYYGSAPNEGRFQSPEFL